MVHQAVFTVQALCCCLLAMDVITTQKDLGHKHLAPVLEYVINYYYYYCYDTMYAVQTLYVLVATRHL